MRITERVGRILGTIEFYKQHKEEILPEVGIIFLRASPFSATRPQIISSLKPGESLAVDPVAFEPRDVKDRAEGIFPKSSGWVYVIRSRINSLIGFAYINGQLQDENQLAGNIRYLA